MGDRQSPPVMILGGYGSLGSKAAHSIRRLHPDLPIGILGRDMTRARAVAQDLGQAEARAIDLEREDLGLEWSIRGGVMLVALRDLSLRTIRFAADREMAYVALSDGVFEIGPTVARFVHQPDAAPAVLLGHSMGAVPMMAALLHARRMASVHAIRLGLVFDPADRLGPASVADMTRIAGIGPAPLLKKDGKWMWASREDMRRRFVAVEGEEHAGEAVGLVDVLGLASTGARDIRVGIAQGLTATRRAGGPPSHEVIVEIDGQDASAQAVLLRQEIVDVQGYAWMSAKGVALVTERLLGLDGSPPPPAGLYMPETLLDPERYAERIASLGLQLDRR